MWRKKIENWLLSIITSYNNKLSSGFIYAQINKFKYTHAFSKHIHKHSNTYKNSNTHT